MTNYDVLSTIPYIYSAAPSEILASSLKPDFYRQFIDFQHLSVKTLPFSKVALETKTGIPIKSNEREGEAYPYYGANGPIDTYKTYNFEGEYVLTAQDGHSIGSVFHVNTLFWANNHVWVSKIRRQFDAAYVATYLSVFKYWYTLTTGTAIPKLTKENLNEIVVLIPVQSVQEYIGAKVRLAERCRARARELWKTSEQLLFKALGIPLGIEHFEHIDRAELQSDSYKLVGTNPAVIWVQPDIVKHELGPHYFHPRRANVILKLRSSGVELGRLTDLTERRSDRVRANKVSQVPYYVGLADIDSTTGYFEPVSIQKAGISGTSALFKPGDILFSKLRPYLNKVSICPAHIKQACGSTELLVYHAYPSVLPYYVFFAVKSNLGLYQIIDVTAGSTLPRVNPEIVDDILVPIISVEQQRAIDVNVRQVLAMRHRATQLVRKAKADVEALIEGRLDVEAIVAGRVQPPTWEDDLG